jgi:hypothetical protein
MNDFKLPPRAYVEIDHVAVEKDIWKAVQNGDEKAKEKLRSELNGLELYEHILSLPHKEFEIVTLSQLDAAGLIRSVQIR